MRSAFGRGAGAKVLARHSPTDREGRITSSLNVWLVGATVPTLQSPVLHPVLVDGEIVENFRVAAGGAGQQRLLLFSHQPPAGGGSHVAADVLAGPGVEPGVEAPVQPGVDPLVRLQRVTRSQLRKEAQLRHIETASSCMETIEIEFGGIPPPRFQTTAVGGTKI